MGGSPESGFPEEKVGEATLRKKFLELWQMYKRNIGKNPYGGTLEEQHCKNESRKRDPGVLKEESWGIILEGDSWNLLEEDSWKRNPRGGILEEEWKRNARGGILEEESWRRNPEREILKT